MTYSNKRVTKLRASGAPLNFAGGSARGASRVTFLLIFEPGRAVAPPCRHSLDSSREWPQSLRFSMLREFGRAEVVLGLY